ncbi:hypothetical protein [Olivibacter jilunii]|uniref:hypothetical protein n=1 Tax=Olivibacter jilunii TaxID=985016 RepID=UPI0036707053
MIAKKNQHYRRALQLFIEIPYLETAEERAQHAITLLRDHRAVQDYWRLIDEFKETGKEITSAEQTLEEEVNDLTLIELAKESKNLPPNISKTKAKLKDLPDGKKRSKALVKLQLFEKRLELVKIRIKQLSDEQQVDR